MFVLELTATGEGPAQGNFVGVLQVAAYGEAAGKRRYPHRKVLDLLGDV